MKKLLLFLLALTLPGCALLHVTPRPAPVPAPHGKVGQVYQEYWTYPAISSLSGSELLLCYNGAGCDVTTATLASYAASQLTYHQIAALFSGCSGSNVLPNLLTGACVAGGGGGTPGGSSFQLQYNSSGAFGGIPSVMTGYCLTDNGSLAAPSFQVCSVSPVSNQTILGNISGSTATPIGLNGQQVQGVLVLANENVISSSPGTGPINDFDPTGWGTTIAYIHVTPASGGTTIDGLVAGSAMQEVIIDNAEAPGGADNVIFMNESASDSTAANRFHAVGNIVIAPGGKVRCVDEQTTLNRWSCN